MKTQLRYEQLSSRLVVEGLPDVSAGQGGEAIGIITGWQLDLAGRTELEGRREHLLALMQVVLPYARHLISGVARRFGDDASAVQIEPRGRGHRLVLRSSQADQPSLDLQLDDAELSDLVRCLDQLRLDPRLQLPLELPQPEPLRAADLSERTPRLQRLAAPLGGTAALLLSALVSWMVPPPPRPAAVPATPVAPAAGSPSPAPAGGQPGGMPPGR